MCIVYRCSILCCEEKWCNQITNSFRSAGLFSNTHTPCLLYFYLTLLAHRVCTMTSAKKLFRHILVFVLSPRVEREKTAFIVVLSFCLWPPHARCYKTVINGQWLIRTHAIFGCLLDIIRTCNGICVCFAYFLFWSSSALIAAARTFNSSLTIKNSFLQRDYYFFA